MSRKLLATLAALPATPLIVECRQLKRPVHHRSSDKMGAEMKCGAIKDVLLPPLAPHSHSR